MVDGKSIRDAFILSITDDEVIGIGADSKWYVRSSSQMLRRNRDAKLKNYVVG